MTPNKPKARLTEKRILKLTNDLAEGIENGTAQEWRAVADYWASRCTKAHSALNEILDTTIRMRGKLILDQKGRVLPRLNPVKKGKQ